MPRYADLTGQRFGRLTITHELPERHKSGAVRWQCKCDCGNDFIAITADLKRGNTKSCGCLVLDTRRSLDLAGKRFGMLTAIEKTDFRKGTKGKEQVVWRCKCDCGNEALVPSNSLTSFHTMSCGCLVRQSKAQDMTGKRFGKLLVIRRVDNRRSGKSGNEACWLCKCDCGNECIRSTRGLNCGSISCGCYKKVFLDGNPDNRAEDNIQIVKAAVIPKLSVRHMLSGNPDVTKLAIKVCELEIEIENKEQSL